jgi:6-phosphofructokinase 1
MGQINTIGVLTSGGDAPGMNPCIRAVVRSATAKGIKVIGIESGYEGLIHGDFHPMGPRDVGGILQRGGTILKTARSEDFRLPHGQREAIRQMNNAGIDGLVVIGGDGSLQGATKLAAQGVPVVGVPGSIDNDLYGTDMAIGVDTALNTIVETIDKLRDTATSHNRAFFVETMGRSCGYLALTAGIVCGAEMSLIPEVKTPIEDVTRSIEDAYLRGKQHCIVVVAEGYKPGATKLAEMIKEIDTGFNIRVTILGHVQRGGSPTSFDRLLATRFGVQAVTFLLEGKTSVMTGLDGKVIVDVPLADVVSRPRNLSPEFIEMASFLAK